MVKGLVNYEQAYRWYIKDAINQLIAEKIMYAELRPMLLDKHIETNDGRGKIDTARQMEIILEEVNKKKKNLRKSSQSNLFPYGLKIIYCTPRSIPIEKMKKELEDCINLKVQYPDLICGKSSCQHHA